MKKKKVLVVTGTRAEYGYLRPVLKRIQKSKVLDLKLLVTGMHTLKKFGHTIDEVRKDGFPIDCIVKVDEHDTMIGAFSKELQGIDVYCRKERPDILLIIGDRGESFAAALVAGHLGIPIVHLSGGDTSGFIVDEAIRHSISKFAHVHCTWTDLSARRLRALGEEHWRIHVTGSTTLDELRGKKIQSRRTLAKRLGLRESAQWLVVIQHPTPLDSTSLENQIRPTLEATRLETMDRIIIYPNSDTGSELFIRAIKAEAKFPYTHLVQSLPHAEYFALLKHASVLVGNSSSGVAEAGFFHLPVVNVGNRQKGREHIYTVIHTPYKTTNIVRAIARAHSASFIRKARQAKNPYDRGNASGRIVRILEKIHIDERLLHKRIVL